MKECRYCGETDGRKIRQESSSKTWHCLEMWECHKRMHARLRATECPQCGLVMTEAQASRHGHQCGAA